MATFTVEITPDSSNGTIAHAVGKFSGGSSSYKGQRRMDVAVSGVGTFSALSPETSGGENTFSLDITGLTPGTTYNWSASLYYQKTSGSWVTAGSQFDKSGSFTTANSGTTSTGPLSAKAVGSIVKLKVNGTAKEFIVVHQGKPSSLYDDSCNGTWLLMKDIYENRVWQSGNINKYESSDIHTYLNNTFLNMFESNIRDVIKQVKIPYRKNGGSGGTDQSGANGLSTKIFLLSGYEIGLTTSDNSFFPVDGAKLSYFEAGTGSSALNKRVAYLNGSAANWWLRSPGTDDSYGVWYVYASGYYFNNGASSSYGVRPALVLPQDMEVDSSGNVTPPSPATHKTLVNGTVYEVKGGKCLVNGTAYSIKKGRTLIGGTGYDINFEPDVSLTWYFNQTLPQSAFNDGNVWTAGFVSGNEHYAGISAKFEKNSADYCVMYWNDTSGTVKTKAYGLKEYSWVNWNGGKRTITFDEEPSGTLLTWLKANATPQ